MSRRVIIAQFNYSSQSKRDSALSAINTALAPYSVINDYSTAVPGGINTSGTTSITISIEVDDRDTAFDVGHAIYTNANSSSGNRMSSGYMSVNRI